MTAHYRYFLLRSIHQFADDLSRRGFPSSAFTANIDGLSISELKQIESALVSISIDLDKERSSLLA